MERDPWLGKVIAGRYRVVRALGDGGMGAVYVAVQSALDREVALKVIRPDQAPTREARARFEREARAIAKLNHPNIITIHDFGAVDDGGMYIVMELLDGRTVGDVVRGRPMAWKRALFIVRDVASALTAAHAAGIIHRDIKPANVMLVKTADGDESAKVLDFGIAKLAQGAADDTGPAASSTITHAGLIVGTPHYMAPEVAAGAADLDGRLDLFSLGLVWAEMLTGRRVYDGRTPTAALVQAATSPIPSLAELNPAVKPPAAVERIVQQLLERDRERRTQSAAALVEQLEACIAGLVTSEGASPRVAAQTARKTIRDTLHDDDDDPAPAVTQPSTMPTGRLRPAGGARGIGVIAGVAAAVALALVVGVTFVVAREMREPDPSAPAGGAPLASAPPTPAPPAPAPAPPTPAQPAPVPAPPDPVVAPQAEAAAATQPAEPVAITPAPAPPVVASAASAASAALAHKKKRPPPVITPKAAPPRRLTSDDFEAAFMKNLGKARACTNTNITLPKSGPGLLVDHCPSYHTVDGLQQIVLTIAPGGDVTGARFRNPATGATKIGACVLQSVKAWKFPAFDGDPVEIAQTMSFKTCVPIDNVCVFNPPSPR